MATEPVVVLERARVLHCEWCPRVFLERALREAHVAKHSDDSKMVAPVVVLERVSQFWCAACSASFPTHRDLQLHRVRHIKSNVMKEKLNSTNDTKPHKCPSCDARFVLQSTLRLHRVLHEPAPHVCHCGVGYRRAQDYRGHLQLVHGESASQATAAAKGAGRTRNTAAPAAEWEPLTCYQPKPVVVSRTDRAKQRKRPNATPNIKPMLSLAVKRGPMLSVDLVSAPKISKKSKGGNRKSGSTRVKRDPNEKPRFICDVCNKGMASKQALEIHLRVHTGEKPFECEICERRFNQAGAVKLHVVRHHGAPGGARARQFPCGVCHKALSSKFSLQVHARTHTGERPYECAVCHKGFADPSAHIRHVRTHTGVKPYACAECGERFSDASAHIQHRLRWHRPAVRPHACAECHKRFAHAYDVRLHAAAVHGGGGGGGFTCDHCGKRFPLKSYLAGHMERRHVPRRRPCPCCGAVLRGMLAHFMKHVDKHGKKKGRRRKRMEVSDDNEM